MNIINPYLNDGVWLKGSFHNHSANSLCGKETLEKIYEIYSNYDFFAVSDHDIVSEMLENIRDTSIFPAIEVSSSKSHFLLINPPDNIMDDYSNDFTIENYQRLSDLCIKNFGISMICHPNRFSGEFWEENDMKELKGYTGIEILSGCGDIIEEDVAFDKWDMLLSENRKIWGFGNDDFHLPGQEKRVWNMVLAEHNSKESILESIKRGSFYVSTGYEFDFLEVEGNTIITTLKSNYLLDKLNKYVRFIGKNGKVLKEVSQKSNRFEYECIGIEGYVRVEAYLEGGYGVFSQPFFVNVNN